MRSGGREFAPGWMATTLMAVACSAFVALGSWQWQRGVLRQAQAEAFAAGTDRVHELGAASLAEQPRFQRISVIGRYDTQHQFLLDNRVRDGRAGYEVLTPLIRDDGRGILVNRGWLPFTGFRQQLPDVSFEAPERARVVGRVDELPVAGLEGGRASPTQGARWPRVTTFPNMAELSGSLGRQIEPRIVLLDASEPSGYARSWQPPGLTPMRHLAYAIQWWSFAALSLILWLVMNWRRIK